MSAADDDPQALGRAVASAPGKVMWAGEYAVLDGAPAVLSAVARRAVARAAAPGGHSPVLSAVRAVLAERSHAPRVLDAARQLMVDTSALAERGVKLGVGSSAATAVCAAGLALASLPADAWRAEVHAVAHAAHARAQGGGSGADVAASVHGGLLTARLAAPGAPLATAPLPWPAGLAAVLVDTGLPASSPELVARVRAFRAAQPTIAAPRLTAIADAAHALAAQLAAGEIPSVIATIAAAGEAIAALGRDAGLELVPAALAPTLALALRHGGAAKPTGAGGGDQLLVVLASNEAAEAFCQEATFAQLRPWPLVLDPVGVRLEPTPENT